MDNRGSPRIQEIVQLFNVRLAVLAIITLAILYIVLGLPWGEENAGFWKNLLGLIANTIPSSIAALMAVIAVYFLLYRHRLTPEQLSSTINSEEIANHIVAMLPSVVRYTTDEESGKQYEENDRLINILRRLIRDHKQSYKYRRYELATEIQDDGSSEATRIYEVEPLNENRVSWIDIGFGLVQPASQGSIGPRIVSVSDIQSGDRLEHMIYHDVSDRMYIFFRQPISSGQTKRIEIIFQYERSWSDLINNLEDYGSINVENEINKLILKLILPRSLRAREINLNPEVDTPNISSNQMEATWEIIHPKRQKYTYTLKALRAS